MIGHIKQRADLFFTIIKLPIDFLFIIGAGITTYLFRTKILSAYRPALFEFNLPLIEYFYIVVFSSFVLLATYAISGLYSYRSRIGLAEEFLKIFIASSAGLMMFIIYIFLRQELFNSRFLVLGAWILVILFVFIGRLILRLIQRYAISKDFGVPKVVIIGEGSLTEKAVAEFNGRGMGYHILGVLSQPDISRLREILKDTKIDRVILASTHYKEELTHELIDFCHDNYIDFFFIPSVHQLLSSNFTIDVVGSTPLIELKRTSLDGWGHVAKRLLDVVSSFVALIILSPFFIVLGIIIKLDTKGPMFVRLIRISQSKEFLLLKFRSMIAYDPDGSAHSLNPQFRRMANDRPQAGPLWKMRNDPRITRVGRIIRKTRIDELPQLWNVLKGDMSLVGPRPHQPDEVAQYEKHHRRVLAIKPGATGLAQISGSSDIPFEEEVALDTFYIENWSVWLDLKIIFKTAFKMLSDRSAV